MSDEYMPTDSDIRMKYASIERLLPRYDWGAEFDRWMTMHDRAVAAAAVDGYADYLDRSTKAHGYVMDDFDWHEHGLYTKALRAYAETIRTPQSVSTPKDADA